MYKKLAYTMKALVGNFVIDITYAVS